MAFVERALMLFFVVMAVMTFSSVATTYTVGDAAGWTTQGHPDYKTWAETKQFAIGDTIVFNYDPKYHNVLQVSYDNYKICNATAPVQTYTSGKDTFEIKKYGHYYFLCGVPQHCQMGQKVDIRVPKPEHHGMAPTPSGNSPSAPLPSSPSPSPSPSSMESTAPAPAPSNANALISKGLVGKLAAAFGFVVLAAGFAY